MNLCKCFLSLSLALFFGIGLADDETSSLTDYKPIWTVGQSWDVEVEKMTEPPMVARRDNEQFVPKMIKYLYHFEVEGTTDIKGISCFQVRINSTGFDGHKVTDSSWFYRAYFSKTDLAFIRVERIKWGKVVSNDFLPGPVEATDWVSFIPMDFPSFNSQPSIIQDSEMLFQTYDSITRTMEGIQKPAVTIVLTKWAGEPRERKTTMTWVKGLPWWIEARHERDGSEFCSARLILPEIVHIPEN